MNLEPAHCLIIHARERRRKVVLNEAGSLGLTGGLLTAVHGRHGSSTAVPTLPPCSTRARLFIVSP